MENKTKHLIYFYSIIIFSLILRCINENTSNLSFILLSILPFLGRPGIIFSIFFLWLFSALNGALVPQASYSGLLRYLILFNCFIASILNFLKNDSFKNFFITISTFLFILFIIAHSIFFSLIVEVSILKSISWFTVFILLLSTWSSLDEKNINFILKNLIGIISVITLLSIPFLFSDVGFIKNSHGFQGIIAHPQTFGCLMAIFTCLLVNQTKVQINSIFQLVMILISIYFIIESESRTALLSLIGFTLTSIIINPTFNKKYNHYSLNLLIIFPLTILIIPLVFHSLYLIDLFFGMELMVDFFNKRNNTDGIFNAFMESRGFLIQKSLDNINSNLYSGIGFGIASDIDNQIIYRDPFFGIPYGAPFEKGFFYTGVLEELGLFGFIFFLFWLFCCFLSSTLSGSKSIPLFVFIILMNFGEASLFSVGGIGGLLIIFFTLSIAKRNLIT